MVEHVYPVNATGVNVNYQIKITWTNPPPDGDYYSTIDQDPFTLKATTSLNGAGYTPPDETWEISSSATYNPPVQGAFPPGSQFNGNALGGAQAYIKYAPAHNGKLLKPLIFVDGIDFNSKTYTHNGEVIRHGSTGWDVLVMGNDAAEPNPFDVDQNGVAVASEFSYYPTAFNTFLSEPNNYDIIFLDFGEGADWIQKNGLELIELINRVNERKAIHAANGETVCDNAVIGASMGGQVVKWALSTMEEQGVNHQTHTYVSFDSPHRGAYLPASLQAFALLSNRAHIMPESWESLNSPAARQMVMRHISAGPQFSGIELDFRKDFNCISEFAWQQHDDIDIEFSSTAAIRSGYEGEVAALGYPQITRNVAISCGSRTGTPQGVPEGGVLFEAGRDVGVNRIAGYCNDPGNVQLGYAFYALMRAAKGGPPGSKGVFHISVCEEAEYQYAPKTVFAGFIPKSLISFSESDIPCAYVYLNATNLLSNTPNFENASGCSRTDIIGLKKAMDEVGVDVIASLGKFSFMPTISALDIQWPMDDEHLNMEFDPLALPNQGLTPFDAVYAEVENLRHIELTPDMVTFVIEQLNIGFAAANASLNLASGQTFNYGKRRNRVPDVTIPSGARLAVNLSGTINYMTPQDPVADKPHFNVYTGGGCNQGKTVTVKSGGVLQIGDPGSAKTGHFHALAQSVIHVESGGILRISNASALIIYKGATLILDPGAIVRLDSTGSSIEISGDLVVNGNIVFGGLGYFHFAEGNRLVFGPGYNTFKLTGAGKDKRFVRLSAEVLVDTGHRLNWSHGLLEVDGGALRFTEGAGLDFTFMTLSGGGGGNGNTAIDADGSGAIKLQGCRVEKLQQAIVGQGGLGCSIFGCEFLDNRDWGVLWRDAFAVWVENSIFDGGNATSTALHMENVGFLLLDGSQFFGYVSPIHGFITDGELDQTTPAVNLYNMVACIVDDSHFSGNTIGIKAADSDAPANVYAFGGSSFVQNTAGIYVNGNAGAGAVLADCVLFDQNLNGIRGRDITLMIDSWNSKDFAFDTDSPNKFIRDNAPQGGTTTDHVRICYGKKGPGGSHMMRNNYWGIATGGVPLTDPVPQNFISLMNAACSADTAAPVFVPFSSRDLECIMDERPDNFSEPFAGSECMLAVGGGDMSGNAVKVHEQFHLGTFLLRADSLEAGIEALRPVAALWQPDLSGFADNCQQYVRVAKAFVDASDGGLPGLPRPGGDRADASRAGSLVIAPNPASHSALLQLPAAPHHVRVWDARGQCYHQAATASSAHRLETVTWQPGIYFVEAVDADGSRRSGKLVVQR